MILNNLIGAALFITATTTSLTASLIVYRIYSLSRNDPLNRAKQTFGKLVDALIQSAAAYAIVSVWYAIETVIPQNVNNIWVISALDDYLFFIFPIVAVRHFLSALLSTNCVFQGVASTSMVARVALISSRDAAHSGIAPVSGLQFHAEGSSGDTSNLPPSSNQVYMISSRNGEPENKEVEHLEQGQVS